MPALPFLEAEPDLGEHLSFAWKAFWHLSSDRQLGMTIGPIAWSSIDAYARRFGIRAVDEFEEFHELLAAMDDAYLKHMRDKAPDKGAT